MKRIFALLLALLLLAALTGCWPLEEQYTEKPVIYLYPEAETDVTVRLDYAGRPDLHLSCLRLRVARCRRAGRHADR